jgi:hypothetical protein
MYKSVGKEHSLGLGCSSHWWDDYKAVRVDSVLAAGVAIP